MAQTFMRGLGTVSYSDIDQNLFIKLAPLHMDYFKTMFAGCKIMKREKTPRVSIFKTIIILFILKNKLIFFLSVDRCALYYLFDANSVGTFQGSRICKKYPQKHNYWQKISTET